MLGSGEAGRDRQGTETSVRRCRDETLKLAVTEAEMSPEEP